MKLKTALLARAVLLAAPPRESALPDDCERHENGFQTVRNPMPGRAPATSTIRPSPTWADWAARRRWTPTCGSTSALSIAAASKVWGGQIHEIEAVGWTAPYQIPDVFGVK